MIYIDIYLYTPFYIVLSFLFLHPVLSYCTPVLHSCTPLVHQYYTLVHQYYTNLKYITQTHEQI